MFTKIKKLCIYPAFLALATVITSCSMNLTHLDGIDTPQLIPFFEPISIRYDGKEQMLDVQLQRAYTTAVDTSAYPMESCRGNIDIEVSVNQDSKQKGSAWYIPVAIFPLWPTMPVNETWTYQANVRIFCNGSLAFKAQFQESEKIEAFWYGKLRSDLVNKASQAMHQRLLNRLKYELQMNRHTDLNAGMS